jgi:hypothetical protein
VSRLYVIKASRVRVRISNIKVLTLLNTRLDVDILDTYISKIARLVIRSNLILRIVGYIEEEAKFNSIYRNVTI